MQDIHRQWYYAKLMGPCIGLNFAQNDRLRYRTRWGRFDKFSSILRARHDGRARVAPCRALP